MNAERPFYELNRDHVVPLGNRDGEPRVVLFSTFDETYAPLAAIARPNWAAYCERRGYALRLYPNEFHLDPSKPDTYGDKIRFRLYYDLRGHADLVMHLDIDSLFMNFDDTVESHIGDDPFFYTYDKSGPLSGLWVARTDETTESHLRYAYALAATESNVRHGKIEPNGISDQDAMRRIMYVPPFSDTFGFCHEAIAEGHCYPENYYDEAWLVTFPGRPVAEKFALMKEWSAKV